MSSSNFSTEQLRHESVRQVVLVEKPRHLVEEQEDLERLFPRCPPNTLESASRQSRRSKRRPGSGANNNNDNDPCNAAANESTEAKTPVANIIDLVSLLLFKTIC